MADEEDAADIIISLGAAASLPGLAAVGYRLSQSAASSLDDPMEITAEENEAYYRLQSLGITVSKASSADIL